MDSMRSLNTSLPNDRPHPPPQPRSRSRHNRPELISAFKGAALAVTNLYKSVVADESRSRGLGYQSALEDLLAFLDAEGLGLMGHDVDDGDGEGESEGALVRQWVLGRMESGERESENADSEEERERERERGEGEKNTKTKSLSPVSQEENTVDQRPSEPERGPVAPETNNNATTTKTPMFTFTANPSNGDVTMQTADSEPAATITVTSPPHLQTTTTSITTDSTPVNHQPSLPLRVELKSKSSRVHKLGRTSTRLSSRESNLVGGTKRKINFPDFFDFTNDGSTGGDRKRGRFG